jgi:hypothetical protein
MNRERLLAALVDADVIVLDGDPPPAEAPRPGQAKTVNYACSIGFKDIDLGEPLLCANGDVRYFGGMVNGQILWR